MKFPESFSVGHSNGSPNPSDAAQVTLLYNNQITDFPYLGICLDCRRIAWFKRSWDLSKEPWTHECNPFASPYGQERVWDTHQSVLAHEFNLRHLLLETNDYLQEKFGSSPYLIQDLPKLPVLYWVWNIPPSLNPYVYQSTEIHDVLAVLEKRCLPFLALCPHCIRIVWFNGSGDIRAHWPSHLFDGTQFSTEGFADLACADVDDEMRRVLEEHNHRFRRIFEAQPSLKKKFRAAPSCCRFWRVPERLPCGQIIGQPRELWFKSKGDKTPQAQWVKKVTKLHFDLLSQFGETPHDLVIIPCRPHPIPPTLADFWPGRWGNQSPEPDYVWPLIEDPDVREIADFRDRMQSFLQSRVSLLRSKPKRPAWSPVSRVERPYKAFSNLTPAEWYHYNTRQPEYYIQQRIWHDALAWPPIPKEETLRAPGSRPGLPSGPTPDDSSLVPLSNYLCLFPYYYETSQPHQYV